jgi:hypothetical protein
MRALPAATALGLLLGGCVAPSAHPPKAEREGKISYNRRELESRPGVFTGRDGVWTIYRSDADRPAPAPPAPPKRTTLSCERGHVCDPAPGAEPASP